MNTTLGVSLGRLRADHDRHRQQIGRDLVVAAVTLTNEHKRRLNISNPRPYHTPSKPGEYPRKRLGFGQAGLIFSPSSPGEVASMFFPAVVVGFTAATWYMEHLAEDKGRLGLLDTVDDMRATLEAICRGRPR
jgi:hypothetical protein